VEQKKEAENVVLKLCDATAQSLCNSWSKKVNGGLKHNPSEHQLSNMLRKAIDDANETAGDLGEGTKIQIARVYGWTDDRKKMWFNHDYSATDDASSSDEDE
jgi:hypothetical protein